MQTLRIPCTYGRLSWQQVLALNEVHIGATWRIRLNPPCAAAMRPYVKLLWPLVLNIAYIHTYIHTADVSFRHVHYHYQYSYLLSFPEPPSLYMTLKWFSPFTHPTSTEALITYKTPLKAQQISYWVTVNILTLYSSRLNSYSLDSKSTSTKFATPHSTPPTLLATLASFRWTFYLFWPDFSPVQILFSLY